MRVVTAGGMHSSFTEGAKRAGISAKLADKFIGRLEEQLDANCSAGPHAVGGHYLCHNTMSQPEKRNSDKT